MTLEIAVMLLLAIFIFAYISTPLGDIATGAIDSVGDSAVAEKTVLDIANKIKSVSIAGAGANDSLKVNLREGFLDLSCSATDVVLQLDVYSRTTTLEDMTGIIGAPVGGSVDEINVGLSPYFDSNTRMVSAPIDVPSNCDFSWISDYNDSEIEICFTNTGGAVSVNECDKKTCYCTSCANCTAELGKAECDRVVLVRDLTVPAGDCITISDTARFFDCEGSKLTGDGSSTAIDINADSATVQNCYLESWGRAIDLSSDDNRILFNHFTTNDYSVYVAGDDNLIESNTFDNDQDSIRLNNADNNKIYQNRIEDSNNGLLFIGSNNNLVYWNRLNDNRNGADLGGAGNRLISNVLCNDVLDISNDAGDSGDNNRCDLPGPTWSDDTIQAPLTGCVYSC